MVLGFSTCICPLQLRAGFTRPSRLPGGESERVSNEAAKRKGVGGSTPSLSMLGQTSAFASSAPAAVATVPPAALREQDALIGRGPRQRPLYLGSPGDDVPDCEAGRSKGGAVVTGPLGYGRHPRTVSGKGA